MIERDALVQEGQALMQRAATYLVVRSGTLKLVIPDGAAFERIAEDRKVCKAFQKQGHALLDPFVASAHKAWKDQVALRDATLAPFDEFEGLAKDGIEEFQAEMERQRLAAEAAQRRERERLEAEALAAAEAEQARLQREAEDAAIEAAATAEQNGDVQTAERILAAPIIAPTVAPMPVFTPPAMTMPAAPQVAGLSFRDKWDAELESLADVVREVAAGRAPLTLLKLDESATRKYAESTRGTVKVRGLRFVNRKVSAQRI